MKPTRKYNKQPNALTQSASSMTLIEKRLMYHVINQLDNRLEGIQENLFHDKEFTFPLSVLGATTNYAQTRAALLKLNTRQIKVLDNALTRELDVIVPFPHVKINKGGGSVTVTLYSKAVPYFCELKRGFTKYDFMTIICFTSVYSQKLYEHFCSWKNKGKWDPSIEGLKTSLDAENYKTYKDFRVRCLEPAIAEINEKSELSVSWSAVKTGRAVTDIVFHIETKNDQAFEEVRQDKKLIEESTSKLPPADVAKFASVLFREYAFSAKVQDEIMADRAKFDLFVDIHLKYEQGLIKPDKTIEAYMIGAMKKLS